MVKKTDAFRQRRAADTARWRERLKKGTAIYPVEVDGQLFDLMQQFGGLRESEIDIKAAVTAALGRLLGRAIDALYRERIDRVTRHSDGRKPR